MSQRPATLMERLKFKCLSSMTIIFRIIYAPGGNSTVQLPPPSRSSSNARFVSLILYLNYYGILLIKDNLISTKNPRKTGYGKFSYSLFGWMSQRPATLMERSKLKGLDSMIVIFRIICAPGGNSTVQLPAPSSSSSNARFVSLKLHVSL